MLRDLFFSYTTFYDNGNIIANLKYNELIN